MSPGDLSGKGIGFLHGSLLFGSLWFGGAERKIHHVVEEVEEGHSGPFIVHWRKVNSDKGASCIVGCIVL